MRFLWAKATIVSSQVASKFRPDDVTYAYDDVTYAYDDVTYVYDDVGGLQIPSR